jgi:two-component system, cell cycle response regulator DivK
VRQRILIVEDTEDNLRIARDLLNSAGYDLLEATDGAAGVSMAALHHPDLILEVDPIGWTGIGVT